MSRSEADAQLAAIDDVVARVKQSRVYRAAGSVEILWGVLQFVQFAVASASTSNAYWSWIPIDAAGVAVTLVMLRSAGAARGKLFSRYLGAFALFYGFGFMWSFGLARFGPREITVFWHTLFLFGNCLAGLWFGFGFLAIGLGLTALILLAYVFAGAQFWLWIALITGFGYILCGYWMRRA